MTPISWINQPESRLNSLAFPSLRMRSHLMSCWDPCLPVLTVMETVWHESKNNSYNHLQFALRFSSSCLIEVDSTLYTRLPDSQSRLYFIHEFYRGSNQRFTLLRIWLEIKKWKTQHIIKVLFEFFGWSADQLSFNEFATGVHSRAKATMARYIMTWKLSSFALNIHPMSHTIHLMPNVNLNDCIPSVIPSIAFRLSCAAKLLLLTTVEANRATGTGAAEQMKVPKLEDNYFENWPAGTELGREGFKHLMRIELRRWEQTQPRYFAPFSLSYMQAPLHLNLAQLWPNSHLLYESSAFMNCQLLDM